MLKCVLDGHGLSVEFDIPAPASCCEHPELSAFLKSVNNVNKNALKKDKNQRLTGIFIHNRNLDSFIEDLLPPAEAKVQKHFFKALLNENRAENPKGLDINFHQNPFDTPERYWNFIVNQGHFPAYFFNRINWYLGPQNALVTDFPLHVDIESASTCNMNCPMCYRSELKHTGQMEFNMFRKIVDECEENHVFSIRLSWRGETLTHPRIKEMIAYATARIKNVSFLTNAFFLDDNMVDCFIDAGVSYVAVSFDGIDETYERIRHPAKFEENYRRLLHLKQKKQEKNSNLPQVRLCTIWPAIRNNPQAYTDKMKKVSDYMVSNPYINFKGPMTIKPNFICQYPWERIVIAYNGDTQCCTGWNADDIILGNITNKNIHEMWHSEQMNDIRSIHSRGARMELNSCARCRHGTMGDPNIDIKTILESKY